MQTVHQMIAATQTIDPVRPANRVVKVEKQVDGGLQCWQASGNVFVIPADESTMQAFVIWTMVHGDSM